ncbi:MAG: nucleotide pyrophosphatase, partial [Thiotrichales bacterium]|nr:nucleotide pyrophosphatase [Thiotrichales bacterium]
MRRAVMVICDGLRSDMVSPQLTPNLCRLRSQATVFKAHRGVFPSTT